MDSFKGQLINLSQLSYATNSFNIGDICIRATYDYESDICDENTFCIPSHIQEDFHKKYGSVLNIEDDFPKLVLYFFLQLEIKKIISDVNAEEFIYKDDINKCNKKLILIGNALCPDEITKLISSGHNVLSSELIKQNFNKSLIVFIVNDIWQLVYFSKRFMEMYEDGNFNYDINVIVNYGDGDEDCNEFYNLSKTSISLIQKILELPGVNISAIGTTLNNVTKCFCQFLLNFHNDKFNIYEYIVKIDTCIEKHDIREIELWNVLVHSMNNVQNGENNKKYTYNNHAYVCYLLNILGINKFNEQNMEFSKKKYENIENIQNIEKVSQISPYFKLKTETIKKYKLWILSEELSDDELYSDKYMSLSDATVQLFHLL